jgi:4-amino-4-deoxy-L-arabinose transferase-like glycosyltransferase
MFDGIQTDLNVSTRNFFILLALAIMVYALNLRLDVMQVDAAQYAEMSWEMFTSHNFFHVHCLGSGYLDKPPLIFWLSTLSYFVFGIHNFAYKLPSFFFALLAIFSTYRLAKMYYTENMARMAAIMLATSQALFLITNDVRTDTNLMGAVIFAIWQGAAFFEGGKTRNLPAAACGVGLAMLAKGPIGIVAPLAALVPHLILKGKWKKFFDRRLFAGVFIIALLLLPMCIGLYQQFGMKGLRFYFWTQSFGRITGESEWNNHPDTFFLLHSTAWAFLPWSLFLLLGWIGGLIHLIRKRLSAAAEGEFISLSGFTLVLIMLMLSKYQLPHYSFVVYPLAAILAAKGWEQVSGSPKARPWLFGLQCILLVGVVAISFLLQYSLKGIDVISLLCLIGVYVIVIGSVIANKSGAAQKLFFVSALLYTAFNFLLSAFYFPAILKYQPQGDFGRYIKAQSKPDRFVCYYAVSDFALVFYAQQMPAGQFWNREDFQKTLRDKKDLLVYTSPLGLSAIEEQHVPYKLIEERESYSVANLSFDFLNPRTRDSVCRKVYLLEAKSP